MHRWLPPPLVVAAFAAAMWTVSWHFRVALLSFAAPSRLAIVFLALGLLLMIAAVLALSAARTTVNPLRPSRASKLVTRGIFRVSRNPIYLGDALVLAALALWLGNAANFVLLALFVAYIDRLQILPEERALTTLFGPAYLDYCARVRRWF
jgi:protein-S-isoprenylcysteine O-methyltransferase Ste14